MLRLEPTLLVTEENGHSASLTAFHHSALVSDLTKEMNERDRTDFVVPRLSGMLVPVHSLRQDTGSLQG